MPSQQFIPGTEPPGRDPVIDKAIEDKYKRVAEAKLAREAVQISDAKLLELVEERGSPYPFLEPGTGKRRVLRLDAKKRLKSERAKSAKQEKVDAEWAAAQAEHRGGDQQDAGREQWEAEVKRRRSAGTPGTKAILEATDTPPDDSADPFAATRAAMDTDDANVEDMRREHETSAQAAVREAEEGRAARRKSRK